jgi:predicted HicB family RNase H-like nuclease
MKEKRFALRISKELKEKLEEKAKDRCVSVARLIREELILEHKKIKIKKLKDEKKGI